MVISKDERVRSRLGAIAREPMSKFASEIAVKRHPTHPPFARSDTKTRLLQIDIASLEAERFAHSQPGTVEHQNQQPIAAPTSWRGIDLCSLSDDAPDLFVRKNTGSENRFGGLRCLTAVGHESVRIVALAKPTELAKNTEIVGHGYRLAMGVAV